MNIILAFILGFYAGMTLMALFIANKEAEKDNKR